MTEKILRFLHQFYQRKSIISTLWLHLKEQSKDAFVHAAYLYRVPRRRAHEKLTAREAAASAPYNNVYREEVYSVAWL